jgi:Ca2+-binding EF-hand superfamily protein
MIQVMPKQLADLFKEKDINKDGSLNFDGFKAAVLKANIKDF